MEFASMCCGAMAFLFFTVLLCTKISRARSRRLISTGHHHQLPPLVNGIALLIRLLPAILKKGGLPAVMNDLYVKYGSVFTASLFGVVNITLLIGPEVTAHFFQGLDSEISHGDMFEFTVPMFGKGIAYGRDMATRNEQKRFNVEAVLKPSRLSAHVSPMLQEVEIYFSKWGKEGIVDLKVELERLLMLITSRCLLGKEVREDMFDEVNTLFGELGNGLNMISFLYPYLPTPASRRRDRAHIRLTEILSHVVESRKRSGRVEEDTLQRLMDSKYKDGRSTTVEEVVALIIALVFGGKHTSSHTSTWTGACLLSHPTMLKLAVQEQEQITKKYKDNGLDYNSFLEMVTLHSCIKETLRMHPPAPALVRKIYFSKWGKEGIVDLKVELERLLMLITSRCLLGKEVREDMFDEVNTLFGELGNGLNMISFLYPYLPTPASRRRDRAHIRLTEILSHVVESRKRSGRVEEDTLQRLMDSKYKDGRSTTVEEVVALINALVFGGKHTSSHTSTWTGACLLSHPTMLKLAVQEQEQITKKYKDNGLDYNSFLEMVTLHSCIKETLRMHPPAPALVRKSYFSKWGNEGIVDLKVELERLLMLITSRCLLGKEVRGDMFDEVNTLFGELGNGLNMISFLYPYLPTPASRRRDRAHIRLTEILSHVVESRKRSGRVEEDTLQRLMDSKYKDGRSTTVEEVVALINALVFGGKHTSSHTSTWTGACLLSHPTMLKLAVQEQEQITKKYKDNGLDYNSFLEMVTLHSCIKETLRMHPPAPALVRKVHKSFTVQTREGKHYEIPQEHIVATPILVNNNIPYIYKDPQVYDPHRFHPERNEDKVGGKFSYTSFGGGRHICNGEAYAYLQIKVIWSHLLRNFELELISPFPKTDWSRYAAEPKGNLFVRYKRTA